MKKLNICIAGAAALLCFNCGDTTSDKIVGTSEEMNELADKGSSSSGTPEVESSSSINDQQTNSSSSGDVHTPPAGGNTLDAYVEQFDLQSKVHFDKSVMAISTSEKVLRTPTIDGSPNGAEFDVEGTIKFTPENIYRLPAYFPKAADKYADLVEATKNGTNDCSLYSFNHYGSEKYAGHVLEYVSPDTMKVVDIEATNCEERTDGQIVHFLVSYCGDLNKEPVIVENTVESSVKKEQCPSAEETEWVVESSSSANVTSSSSEVNPTSSSSSKEIETCLHISDNDGMTANGNCDGDGIPDGIDRPDLEPCDTDTLLYFYGRHYQCAENKWVYLPPPSPDSTESQARNASLTPREGPAVAPHVVMVKNEDGTITIRDDGFNASNNFVLKDVYTKLSGDTIIVDVIYPDDANTSSYQIGVLTFTVSKVFTNVKYLAYADGNRSKQQIEVVDELLPCANNGSCAECPADMDCSNMTW